MTALKALGWSATTSNLQDLSTCMRKLEEAHPGAAATRIDDDDRAGLERLIRYATRPPLAAGRLQIVDDERLTFRLKTPWSDGTTHLVLSPLELIEKTRRPGAAAAPQPGAIPWRPGPQRRRTETDRAVSASRR
jgi:hypothetical protein